MQLLKLILFFMQYYMAKQPLFWSTENWLTISSLISKVVQQMTELLQSLFSPTPIKGKSDIINKRFIHYKFKISIFQILIFLGKFEAFLASSKYWDRMRKLCTQSETQIQLTTFLCFIVYLLHLIFLYIKIKINNLFLYTNSIYNIVFL